MRTPQPGDELGPFLRLVRPLGDGAMSDVWVVEHTALGKSVAIKFVAEHLLKDKTARARFRREANLVEQMRSPHVVRSYGHGETEDGTPYLVMELLEGETLAARLGADDKLSPLEVFFILEQLADAIDEAHELGVVHRDIKPANIFLAAAPDGAALVKILDFGMAKRTGVDAPSVVTEAGTTVGTPDYFSPEQLKDAPNIDHRSDLWAMGVVAYRAMVGQLPFVAGSIPGLCVKICHGEYERASKVSRELPRRLDRWFGRALEVDRDKRFGSAHEMVAALGTELARLGHAEVADCYVGPETVAGVPTSTNWGRIVLWLLVVLAVFAAGALVAWYSS